MKSIVFLLPIIFLSGCVYVSDIFGTQSQVVGGGLVMNLQADPSMVFSSGRLSLNIDMDNQNPRRVYDVVFDVFDPGLFTILTGQQFFMPGSCKANIGTMLPGEFKSFPCILEAPKSSQLVSDRVTTTINANVQYVTDFPTVQLVEMMTEDEYLIRLQSGSLETKPKSYSYQDKNIELLVEFSEPLPIVVRTGKEYYIHFTVKNIGNGFIRQLNFGDFTVNPVNPNSPQIADCTNSGILSPAWSIQPIGKEFPRITCKLYLPGGVRVVENYGLLINVVYDYEVRDSISVQIVR